MMKNPRAVTCPVSPKLLDKMYVVDKHSDIQTKLEQKQKKSYFQKLYFYSNKFNLKKLIYTIQIIIHLRTMYKNVL